MGPDNPWLLTGLLFAGGLVAKWWRNRPTGMPRQGTPYPCAFPGAARDSPAAMVVAAGGVLILLAAKTGGEHVLGLTARKAG